MEREKICPHCGAAIHTDASFCPHCAKNVKERAEPKPPAAFWGKLLRLAVVLLVSAGLVLGVYLYTRPRVYDGAGEVVYTDEDAKYQLLLSYVDSRHEPLPEREDEAELDGQYTVPSCLFINLKDSGADATDGFKQKVDRITTEFIQPEDSPSPMKCSVPTPADYVPEAASVSSINFTGRSGKAELVWTIYMKNGDIIRLRQKYSVKPIATYDYYPEDVPMDDIASLQALIDELDETVYMNDVVNIHLPPVTYDGGLALERRPYNFYGSADGDKRTTFTGNVRINVKYSAISYFYDIDFVGQGSGVGVSAAVKTHLINCKFTGWQTGILTYGVAWVCIRECLFENNDIGFHFNSAGSSVTGNGFFNNRFIGNDTAVLLTDVPTDATLNFSGSVFSGNGKDIDNLCNQPVDTADAFFE